MTNEEAINKLQFIRMHYPSKDIENIEADNALSMAIEALDQQPCEDAISRQAVLDIAKSSKSNWIDNSVLFKRVNELPSVNPQDPKTGQWEYVQYDYNPRLGNWHCSECRCVPIEYVNKNEKGGIPLYKYCPQCGAKMKVGKINDRDRFCSTKENSW